jgi:hypothetical protein
MTASAEAWVPAACTLPTLQRPLRVPEIDRLFATALRPSSARLAKRGAADIRHPEHLSSRRCGPVETGSVEQSRRVSDLSSFTSSMRLTSANGVPGINPSGIG